VNERCLPWKYRCCYAATALGDSAKGFEAEGPSLCLQGTSKAHTDLGIAWEAALRS